MNNINVIIVEDHEIFRNGLKYAIGNLDNITVIAEFNNGQECLDNINNYDVDLIFMDIKMPILDGIQTTTQLIKKYPNLKIIALTVFEDDKYLQNMIDAGAKGFILKNTKKQELKIAIQSVLNNNTYYSQKLLKYFNNQQNSNKKIFSKIEIEILQLISKGLNDDICEILYINKDILEQHKIELMNKTNSKDIIDLISYSLNNNIVTFQELDI